MFRLELELLPILDDDLEKKLFVCFARAGLVGVSKGGSRVRTFFPPPVAAVLGDVTRVGESIVPVPRLLYCGLNVSSPDRGCGWVDIVGSVFLKTTRSDIPGW